jgi:transposase
METFTMSKNEVRYGETIPQIIAGKLSQSEAALLLGLSIRQVKRLCKKFRNAGLPGLIHKNRGKASNNKVSDELKSVILKLIHSNYHDFSSQLIHELLNEKHDIKISAEWIRKTLIEVGFRKLKSQPKQECHQRRVRRSRRGELIQIDGSYHNWFEDRADKCCLLVAIDDATSELMELRFVNHETTAGYMKLMSKYASKYGLPMAFYSDRLNALKAGSSQVSRALSELDVGLINANSPQAKGRVERANGTLQDRLIKLMRLEGISSMKEGNEFLESYLEIHNKRFSRKPRSDEDAHKTVPKNTNLKRIFCEKEQRKVSKNLMVQYKNKTYLIDGKGYKHRLAGKKALVFEGSERVYIEIDGKEFNYKLYEEQPYQAPMNRKEVDAWLNKKKPLTIAQRRRRGMSVNF